jgi:hypothetical protein
MLVQAEKEICFLHKSCVFKLQIPIDRHSPILIPSQCYLSDPPHFSLPSTFKYIERIRQGHSIAWGLECSDIFMSKKVELCKFST